MADHVIIGCDSNNGSDKKFQDTVAKAVREAGYKVNTLDIGPNALATYSWTEKAKGKIGIYLMAGSLVSYLDGADSNFKFIYFGIRGDASRSFTSMNAFKTKGVPKDWHGDCIHPKCNSYAGKTYPELNEIYKGKAKATWGGTPEEMAKNIVTAMGGGDPTGDGSSSGSSKKQEEKGTTIKEALQKLLKHWDGEVECYIRDDKVYVHKVRDPVDHTGLLLQEGLNVYTGSITVKDTNPNTVNHLTVVWTDGEIEFQDKNLIKRFGKKEERVDAVKVISTKSVEYKKAEEEAEQNMQGTHANATHENDVQQNEPTYVDENAENTEEGEGDENAKKKQKTETKPIDNYEDALKFGHLYWNKIRRSNGHSIDCQVTGGGAWKVGEWCRVKFPSFNEDCYMYITRVSQSGDSDWTCNLSLKDYPPGWGTEDEDEEDS